MPNPNPHIAHVTHAWPHWQWPSVYLSARPAFLLRIDRVVEPEAVLSTIRITGTGINGWQVIDWVIRACVIEHDAGSQSSYTTIVFQPAAPLQPGLGGGYNWLVSTREKPVLQPLHEGLTTTNRQAGGVFGVGGQSPQVGAVFGVTTVNAALRVRRDPAEIWSALRNAEESFTMIREWSDLDVPAGADQELRARIQEFHALVGDETPTWLLISDY